MILRWIFVLLNNIDAWEGVEKETPNIGGASKALWIGAVGKDSWDIQERHGWLFEATNTRT
jgi:hypothetical protein